MAKVEVKAVKLGFHECRRYPGERFMVDEKMVSGKKSKWFVVVGLDSLEGKSVDVVTAGDDDPDTFSAITKANAKKDKAAAAKKLAE